MWVLLIDIPSYNNMPKVIGPFWSYDDAYHHAKYYYDDQKYEIVEVKLRMPDV